MLGVFNISEKFSSLNNEGTILGKVFKLFRKPPKPSLSERTAMSIHVLECTATKLKTLSEGLKRRDQLYFEKCANAHISGDHERAIMYANECAEVRKLAKLIIGSELTLEQAILRLQTINKLGDVMSAMSPIVEIIDETRGKLTGIIPSVSSSLIEVNSMLKSSISEMSTIDAHRNKTDTDEANKILKEANNATEESLRAKFPKLPEDLELSEEVTNNKTLVALTATGGDKEDEDEYLLRHEIYEYTASDGETDQPQSSLRSIDSSSDIEEMILKLKDRKS